MMHRRTFLRGLAGSGAIRLWAADAKPLKRRSANPTNPDPPELKGYKKAVQLMKALPDNDPRSWKAQANIHNDYLPAFQLVVPALAPGLSLLLRNGLPRCSEGSEVHIALLGLDAQHQAAGGVSRPEQPAVRKPARSQRGYRPGIAGPSIIRNIMRSSSLVVPFSGSTNSDDQREDSTTGQLEGGPHNGVHGTIGGIMGTYLSPLDPIFWLHHCNIDRLWASWAVLHGNAVPSQPLWGSHNLGDVLRPQAEEAGTVATARHEERAQFNAVYDRLETVAVKPRPVSPQLQSFVMGLKGELAPIGRPAGHLSAGGPGSTTRGGAMCSRQARAEARADPAPGYRQEP